MKQRKPTVGKDRERKGIAEGRGRGVAGYVGRRGSKEGEEKGERSPRGLKKEEGGKERRHTRRA